MGRKVKTTVPSWKNPGSAIARTIKIGAYEPLPSTCLECGAQSPAWIDKGERTYLYPVKRWHRFICPACLFLVVERSVPDEVV